MLNLILILIFRNVTPKLKALLAVDKKLGSALLQDIEDLQWSVHNEATFRHVYDLLEKKYLDKFVEDPLSQIFTNFFTYFRNQWVDGPVFKWYEGANPWHIGNNQGLEGTNKTIKSDHTFKRRCPLGNFIDIVLRSGWFTSGPLLTIAFSLRLGWMLWRRGLRIA